MTLEHEDCDFENYPLFGSFSRYDVKVDVEIYRYAGTQDCWQIVVIDLSSGRPTVWAETFATD